MSLEIESQEGEVTTKPLFSSNEIKAVRFILGAITVEISTNGDPNGSKTLDVNLRQNLNTSEKQSKLVPTKDQTTSQLVPGRPSKPNKSTMSEQEIEEMTKDPKPESDTATKSTKDAIVKIDDSSATNENGRPKESEETKEKSESEQQKEEDYLKSMQGWLMTVATLLMNLAFNGGLNPPAKLKPVTLDSLLNRHYNGTVLHGARMPLRIQVTFFRYLFFKTASSGAFYLSIVIVMQLLFKRSFASVPRLIGIRFMLVYAISLILIMHIVLLSYSPFDFFSSLGGLAFCFLLVQIYRFWCRGSKLVSYFFRKDMFSL